MNNLELDKKINKVKADLDSIQYINEELKKISISDGKVKEEE